MQKLWLKNFEFQINPATWNTAQDLVQAGNVRNIREIEKHFWVSLVEDGELAFETEVMITPHKIKAFTCECWAEGRRLMCPHIAASLLKIRQFLDQKAEARQHDVEQKRSEATGRLTVQAVLEQADSSELANFVRAYARRDRDFALALKTWFAGQIGGADNPFVLLLDTALPRHGGAQPLREPELRRLRKTLDDLGAQVETAAELGNARTIFQIATAVLPKIAALFPKATDVRREQLAEYGKKFLRHLTELPDTQLSPELQEERRTVLFDFAASGQWPVDFERDLIQFLARAAANNDLLFKKINALFDRTPYPAPPIVLHLFLSALASRKMPEAVPRVLDHYTEYPARIKTAVSALSTLQYWQAVLWAGGHFLDKEGFNAGQRRDLEDLMLSAAEKTGDRPRLRQLLRRRYIQTGIPEFLHRLKALAGPDWPTEQRQITDALQESGQTALLAALWAAESDLDALCALLEQQHSLALLQQYEHLLLPDRKNFVQRRYVTLLSEYLSEHFGRQASGYVREQLNGLLHKGQGELVMEIFGALTAQFADRHTLPEELAEMFPKSKRQIV